MGESDRYQDYRMQRRNSRSGQPGNALFALFAINIAAFLILLANVFTLYAHQARITVISVPYNGFAFYWPVSPEFVKRPWTIITFMFAQGGNPPLSALLAMTGVCCGYGLWIYTAGPVGQQAYFPTLYLW